MMKKNIKKLYNEKYFNLKDNVFCLFNGCFIFIIDLFSNNIIKKMK